MPETRGSSPTAKAVDNMAHFKETQGPPVLKWLRICFLEVRSTSPTVRDMHLSTGEANLRRLDLRQRLKMNLLEKEAANLENINFSSSISEISAKSRSKIRYRTKIQVASY